jgi:hypothetical protein
VDEVPIIGSDEDRKLFKQLLAAHGPPAFMRRGQRVQQAYDQLLARCRAKRDDSLYMVRLSLKQLHALAGRWASLLPVLDSEDQIAVLVRLEVEAGLSLGEQTPEQESPVRQLRRAVAELNESVRWFNQRWAAFLDRLDLRPLNELREGYNRYYVLEKECVVRSPRLARQGFQPLPPLTCDDLRTLFPSLPEISLKG